MKISRTTLVAAAISLALTSLPVTAGELPFNAPATERAQESALLLQQTARALSDSVSGAALYTAGGNHISNLWLFPTADADTVFARYNLTSDGEAASGAAAVTTEHLTVLTVRGNRILDSRDLTTTNAELASNEPTKLHWSAAIGTGHAADATVIGPKATSTSTTNATAGGFSRGTPASPDRTAKIGTGTAASAATPDTKQPASPGTPPTAATAHWTSRIGTGHAADSTI